MDLSGSWEYLKDIARSRLANNKTAKHVAEFGEGIELLGAAGELVARRFLGIQENLHDGFDGGIDIFYYGMSIDVKSTVLTPRVGFRYLQWPTYKLVKADYILMTAIDPVQKIGTVLGYALKVEIPLAPVNHGRKIECHEIPVTKLHPAYDLIVNRIQQVSCV